VGQLYVKTIIHTTNLFYQKLKENMVFDKKIIACVTGGSGMVGRKIVRRLLLRRYSVRILTRRKRFDDPDVEVFNGGLEDEELLKLFLSNADFLFHCAAELHDKSKMWDVNVRGTKRLLKVVSNTNIKYLCYLSSAGVVGRTSVKCVDEKAECNPQNAYEKSKWAAEQIVARGINGCRIVILRPTNIIDETKPGAFLLPINGSWKNRFQVFLKGGECAHVVHADDVAEAAMHFVSSTHDTSQCFFVSCDYELLNTFAGLWSLYKAVVNNRPLEGVQPIPHLPLIVPHVLRRLLRSRSNRGDVRYSSEKLISEGFTFPLGLKGAVKQIVSTHHSEPI